MPSKLHMIFDPLCGWCYAASPLLQKLNRHFGDSLPLVFHPGLLFAEPNLIPDSYREHIIAADLHIATLSGVWFGPAYLSKLRNIPQLSYYSVPSSAAVMSMADASGIKAWQMLEKIQHAHYVEGADVSDSRVLGRLAAELGVGGDEFGAAFARAQNNLPALARAAHQLLRQVAAQGFPTFVLEKQGQFLRLNHSVAYQDATPLIAEIEAHEELLPA